MKTWAERIAEARANGGFSNDDRQAAMTWHTCAVGEAVGYPAQMEQACDIYHARCGVGSERHYRVRDAGLDFQRSIHRNEYDKAVALLAEIAKELGEQPSDEFLISATVQSVKASASQPLEMAEV